MSLSLSDFTISVLGCIGSWAYVRISSNVSVPVSVPLSLLDSEVKLISAGRNDSDILWLGDRAGPAKKFGCLDRVNVVVRML